MSVESDYIHSLLERDNTSRLGRLINLLNQEGHGLTALLLMREAINTYVQDNSE